jgi:methylmalonyl-CoA mutase N-terminal domain/subunit
MAKTDTEKSAPMVDDARGLKPFTTISGRPIEPLYRPEDVKGVDYDRDLGDPGSYPYTRGVHKTAYRGKTWTMRQFAGFGSAAQTNERFKYLLANGSMGLSVAFDLPTLMGRDPDHQLSLGEVGKCGVAVTSLEDMETLFDGIPSGRRHHVDDHQLARAHAGRLLHAGGREAGCSRGQTRGHHPGRHPEGIQAQKEYIFPPQAVDAARRRHDPVLHRGDAAVEHDLDLRLPHPRGGLDRGPGARVHAGATASST